MRAHDRSEIKYRNKLFVSLGILLFVLSLIAHELAEFPIYRALRGMVSLVGALLLLYFHGRRAMNSLLFFFLFYGLSSFLTIGYELEEFAVLSMLFNTVAFLIVIRILWVKINFKKIGVIMTSLFIIMSGVLGFLLLAYAFMLEPFSANTFHYIVIIFNSVLAVIIGFFAFLYNHNHSSDKSLTFTGFVVLMIFSEVFRGIGYYEIVFGDLAVFIARILLILSTFLLVKFSLLSDPSYHNADPLDN